MGEPLPGRARARAAHPCDVRNRHHQRGGDYSAHLAHEAGGLQDADESVPDILHSERRGRNRDGGRRDGRMEPGRPADQQAASQHGVPVGVQPVAPKVAVLMEVLQGAVRVRLETDGFGTHRHGMERGLSACNREMLYDGDARTIYAREAVLGHILIEHDHGDPEGELPRAELRPGREDAPEGGIQENHQNHDAAVLRAHVRTRSRGGVAAPRADRRPVGGGGRIPADHSVHGMPVPPARHQPQHAAGRGTLGPVPQAGDSQEDSGRGADTARNLHKHPVDALEQRASGHSLIFPQLVLLREDDRLRLLGAAEGHRPLVRSRMRDDGCGIRPQADRPLPAAATHRAAGRRRRNHHSPMRTAEA